MQIAARSGKVITGNMNDDVTDNSIKSSKLFVYLIGLKSNYRQRIKCSFFLLTGAVCYFHLFEGCRAAEKAKAGLVRCNAGTTPGTRNLSFHQKCEIISRCICVGGT